MQAGQLLPTLQSRICVLHCLYTALVPFVPLATPREQIATAKLGLSHGKPCPFPGNWAHLWTAKVGFLEILPSQRDTSGVDLWSITGVISGLRRQTGYKPAELFRKYLWFLLRERKFNQEAVDDLIHLKSVLNLDEQQATLLLALMPLISSVHNPNQLGFQ